MPIRSRRSTAFVAITAIATAFIWFAPHDASAQSAADKGKKKLEGCMISYDASAGTLVVKDKKSKKDETFKVKQGTSVLDKTGTSVAKNGRGSKLVDLEPNRPVIVYWMPQGEDQFASKIDAPDAMDSETGKLDADIMEDAGCKTE
jgi:hypothetical protein